MHTHMTLRQARLKADITQRELAERAGIRQPAVSSLERGHRANPTITTVRRLETALGVPSGTLIFGGEPNESTAL